MLDQLIEFVRRKLGNDYLQAFLQRAETWLIEEVIAYLQQVVDRRKPGAAT